MKWFYNLPMRNKLFLSFGIKIFFLLVVIIAAFSSIHSLKTLQKTMYNQELSPALSLLTFNLDRKRIRNELSQLIALPTLEERQQMENEINTHSKQVEDAVLKTISEMAEARPAEKKIFDEFIAAVHSFRETRLALFELVNRGQIQEARHLADTVQKDNYETFRRIAGNLTDLTVTRVKKLMAQSETQADMRQWFIFCIGMGILIFSLIMSLFLDRVLSTPLLNLTSASKQMARGELDVDIHSTARKDEVGELTRAFIAMLAYFQEKAVLSGKIAQGRLDVNIQPISEKDQLGKAFADMTAYLKEMAEVSQKIAHGDLAINAHPRSEKDVLGNAFLGMTTYLRTISDVSIQVATGDLTAAIHPVSGRDVLNNAFAGMLKNLRSLNSEIKYVINDLASVVSQILTATNQMAAGMSETATSVTQTTATIEEVKQTVQLTAEKSKTVSDNAQDAVTQVNLGTSAVAEALKDISGIKDLMESVGDSVVTLSEQTQAIGEIIAVVNDLAQQSNILAVNAAIEAAKAGEHGKGFAVVAQEIKSLSDQSRQATDQVREILFDIQKATGRSVMAAEQVSKAVDGCVIQASQSGDSIASLAKRFENSAHAAVQIAASSQEQLVGMEQVVYAMESIKDASQQNVSATRLVEQAAHNVKELGEKLTALTAQFKI